MLFLITISVISLILLSKLGILVIIRSYTIKYFGILVDSAEKNQHFKRKREEVNTWSPPPLNWLKWDMDTSKLRSTKQQQLATFAMYEMTNSIPYG